MGPRLSAGKNVNAPTMTITLTNKKTNKKLSVLKVPDDSGISFFPERFPAKAMTGMSTANLPINIENPKRQFKIGVLALSPAKALPLLAAVDVKA